MEMRVIELKKNILHMCSSIILCATFFLSGNKSDELNELVFTLKLAEFSNTTYSDVTIMANALFELTLTLVKNHEN